MRKIGAKVFMDARQPVTLEEGDHYPLVPPIDGKYLRGKNF